jgi:adenylosuccinate synthase
VQQISMASHAVYVGLPTQKTRMERLLAQVSDVDDTLRARSEELQKVDSKGLNYEEKKWLSDETAAVNTARAQLAQTKQSAEQSLKRIDDQRETLEKDYDKAFAALLEAARAKAPKH